MLLSLWLQNIAVLNMFTNPELHVSLVFEGWRQYSLPELFQRELGLPVSSC